MQDVAVVIGCGQNKIVTSEPVPAEDLYVSTYFDKKSKAADEIIDQFGGDKYILSAKHGAIAAKERIHTYDMKIDDKTGREKERWSNVVSQKLSSYDTVVIYAGKKYREGVRRKLENSSVTVISPFDDTSGIGEQLSLLNEVIDSGFNV